MLGRRMLNKEDEPGADSTTDNEVRREDQEKINRFSRLHQRVGLIEEELAGKKKDKESLSDISSELELAELEDDDDDDDDDLEDGKDDDGYEGDAAAKSSKKKQVPYKIGDSFVMLQVSEAQEMLEEAKGRNEEELGALEDKLGNVREEMNGLKVELYARFGRGINLEG